MNACIAANPRSGDICTLPIERHDGSQWGNHRFIAPGTPFCRDCDGVGWIEGGKTINTKCERCGGDGWEPDE